MKRAMKSTFGLSVGLGALLCIIGADVTMAQSGGGRGMKERFEVLDADGDGQLIASEAAEWHDTVFVTMDADDDQSLTRDEYMAVQLGQGADPEQRGPQYEERQAQKDAQFTEMDADGDGVVTREQFMAKGQSNFETTDADKNGSVSMAEFIMAHWL